MNKNFSRKHFADQGFRSNRELYVESWLSSLGYNPEHSVRELGFEFDIYLRKQRIALEFNGIAWHFTSSNIRTRRCHKKPHDYHYNKTLQALRNGVRLYHFWDFESLGEIKTQILQILKGQVVSEVNVDKNPALIANTDLVLEPRYIITDKCGLYKKNTPIVIKPICWSRKDVHVYEYYNSGYIK